MSSGSESTQSATSAFSTLKAKIKISPTDILEMQEDERLSSTLNANFLYHIFCTSQPGRISDDNRQAAYVQRDLQDIPCRPWDRCDDRCFALSCHIKMHASIIKASSLFHGSFHAIPRKLSKLLFPALGGPKMARRIPERKISPLRLSYKCSLIVSCNM